MKYGKEITVEVDLDIEELKELLTQHNFKVKEKYKVEDFYYIKKDYDKNLDDLEILKQCILIRNIICETENIKLIMYKYKEYDEKGNIVKDGKIQCKVESIEDAEELFKAMGYIKLIEINDYITVYANNNTELCTQQVNDKHLYIELEEKCNYIDKIYSSLDEMKEEINRYNIPIKDNNYFAKKALVELQECCRC